MTSVASETPGDWQSTTTICTCIEAGGLEQQVLLLVESLRAFGGKWAGAPVYTVKPRRGPALRRATVSRLKELGAILVDEPLNDVVPWWDMANKPASLRYVEEHTTTPYVTWMDGDMIVLQEPMDFAPASGKTFKARAGEAHDVASSATGEGAGYWRKLCEVLGLDFDAFPDIISFPDKKPIKAYWQGGLFTYPRETKFGAHFLRRLLPDAAHTDRLEEGGHLSSGPGLARAYLAGAEARRGPI